MIPELTLIHLKDDFYKLNATKLKRAKIELRDDGLNFVKISLVFDTIWDSDIYYFPFDRKTCVMKFDSSSKLFQDVSNFNYSNFTIIIFYIFLLEIKNFTRWN